MSNRLPGGVYLYAGPTRPPWDEPLTPSPPDPSTHSTTTVTVTGLQIDWISSRIDAIEAEVGALKRALDDLQQYQEIKTEIAAVRAAMTEMLERLGPRPPKKQPRRVRPAR